MKHIKYVKLKPRKLKRIITEVSKHSYDLLCEFDKLFPISSDAYTEVSFSTGIYAHYVKLSAERPFQDFWDRWNRFKKLKAFL